MRMKLVLTFFILVSLAVPALSKPLTDTTEKLIQIQLLAPKEAYYLVQRTAQFQNDSLSVSSVRFRTALKYTYDDGVTFSYCNLDSVFSVLQGQLNMPTLNIHFVNKSLGFLYGYSTVYAFYPFLFRTEDGGQTWQTIFAGPAGTLFRRSDFYMFDESRGIIVNNWNSQPVFNYMLTNDGGKTWKPHTFTISRKDIQIGNYNGNLNEVYSEKGQVTIILKSPDTGYRGTEDILVIQSSDFGKTFKELK